MKVCHLILPAAAALTTLLTACQPEPDYANDQYGNFEALVSIMDTRYCFFEEKGIDWKETAAKYRAQLTDTMTQPGLFDICSNMLAELRDGHVNLSSTFSTSYYREWWSDYPQNFNLRTLQEYYLNFDYYQTSGISYKMIEDGIAYMYYPSFSSGIGQGNLDWILALLHDAEVMIIDIRNNGGGMLTNIDVLVSRFIDRETPGGTIRHKTGPAHDDFSDPYAVTYQPADSTRRVCWPTDRPVYVLTNRSCYSAANDFVAVMKSLPNVTVIGSRTGGGGGMPFTSELPIGWAIRFSACPMYAPDGSITEFGIDPTEGCEVDCTDAELAAGHDAILEFALARARKKIESLK